MRVLVLSGTSDGNNIACTLSKIGYNVICTSTTDIGVEYAKKIFDERECNVLNLKKTFQTVADILDFIKSEKIDLVIDSTHPHAENIKKLTLSLQDEILVIRYERPEVLFDYENIIYVDSYEEAVEKCFCYDNIFLAIGTKNLQNFKVLIDSGKKLFVRALPIQDSVRKCTEIGLSIEQLILEKGPFSTEKNIEHFKNSNAQIVVSKDSGEEGGIREKIEACKILNIPIIIVKRKAFDYKYKFSSLEELLNFLQRC